LYAVLDADKSGREATASLVEAFGSRVLPVTLPSDVKDPADLAPRADGGVLFARAIYKAARELDHHGLQ
jgi:hypothetical protein